MVTFLSALLLVQTSTVQFHAGIARAPGGQFGPAARITQSWPFSEHVAFQLEGAFGIAGVDGWNTNCGITGQCFTSSVRFRAWEFEVPTLVTVSLGRVFLSGGPVIGLRVGCNGRLGGNPQSCSNGSNMAWGGAAGIGFQARQLTLEARYQHSATPLLSLFTGEAGGMRDFHPSAVTLTVGWRRR